MCCKSSVAGPASVQRYAHLSAEHLAEYAGNVSRIRAVVSTLSGTPGEEKSESSVRETA